MNTDFVTIKYVSDSLKGQLMLSALADKGIQALQIHDTLSTVLPLGIGSSQIQVKPDFVEEAIRIIADVEAKFVERPEDDFREASKEDIFYEKSINDEEEKLKNANILPMYIVFAILIVGLVVAYLNSMVS